MEGAARAIRHVRGVPMGQSELRSPSVLSSRVGHFVKGVANSNVKAETNNQLSGATEAALPITPERLELIKACAKRSSRNADELAASRIAKRFAPQAPAKPVSGYRSACQPCAPDLAVRRPGVRDPHPNRSSHRCRIAPEPYACHFLAPCDRSAVVGGRGASSPPRAPCPPPGPQSRLRSFRRPIGSMRRPGRP